LAGYGAFDQTRKEDTDIANNHGGQSKDDYGGYRAPSLFVARGATVRRIGRNSEHPIAEESNNENAVQDANKAEVEAHVSI